MPGGIRADPRAELTVGAVRFRLRVWHVLWALILFSLMCWTALFFLIDLAGMALRAIKA